jgi:chromosome segregation protein
MLYLEELTVRNFKSFRNANIKLNKGFNCVIGPNGSGKSNICDAILFALGENSLTRLRSIDDKTGRKSVGLLISSMLKGDLSSRKAMVKVKLGGDREIEIARTVRADKKVAYRLNGKRVTRKEVIEELRSVQSEISDANTITQGEISDLAKLNPKERRELIDVAAGISEFNEKKDAAIRELDRVDSKINEAKVMLGERSSFLKELENDKINAEKYTALNDGIKQMTYTRLKMREQLVVKEFEISIAGIKENTTAKQEMGKRVSEIDTKVLSHNSEKERFTKTLNARSGEAGSTAKLLEETEKSLAVNAAEQKSAEENVQQAKARASQLQDEISKTKAKHKENSQELGKLDIEIAAKSKNVPELGQDTGMQDGMPLAEKYDANIKEQAITGDKLRSLASEEARLKSEYSSVDSALTEVHRTINERGAERALLMEKVKSKKDSLVVLQRERKELEEEYKREKAAMDKFSLEADALYKSEIDLREQLSQLGRDSASRLNDWLKKSIKKGFHGTLRNLLSYDDKYANAVYSAAGSRINYFVVDSIDICNEAIALLKQHKMGRATFIPLKEINARDTKTIGGAETLLSLVKADQKYQRALDYVFSNTYIVAKIADAQKLGIGDHRYVTLDGDLVEPSGIVSGGMITHASYVSVETRLKKLEKEKVEASAKKKQVETALEAIGKKIGSHEASVINYEIEIKQMLKDEEEVNRALDMLGAKAKAYSEKLSSSSTESEKAKTDIKKLDEEAKKLREIGRSLNTALQGLILQTERTTKTKEEMKKFKELVEEVNKLKEHRTKLDTENAVGIKRLEELKLQIEKENHELSALETKRSELEKTRSSLEIQKKELGETLKSQGAKNTGLIEQINQVSEKVAKLSEEKGRLQGQVDRIERDMISLEARKGQLETTLGDIRAELLRNPVMELIEKADISALEADIIRDKAKLDALGNVNLKAPEMYDSKKRDVDDANQKLSTLDSEKEKIISAMQELESKKVGIFMDTFNSVNENFKRLFGYAFPGEARLRLQEPKDPFNSGLMFELKMNKGSENTSLFSGGQKSMLMIILVLSIVVRRPKSFYIFDEIDAALDKENTKLLSKLIKELSSKSQFIVVSHNDTMISSADTAIGVVKRNGESQVVGVQIPAK